MPVRKRNLRILYVLNEMASQNFAYTSASIAHKTLKKTIFGYQMMRGRSLSAPFLAAATSAGGKLYNL